MRATMMPTLAAGSQPAALLSPRCYCCLGCYCCFCCFCCCCRFRCHVAFNQSELTGNFQAGLPDDLTAIRRFALTLLRVYRAECAPIPLPLHTPHTPPPPAVCAVTTLSRLVVIVLHAHRVGLALIAAALVAPCPAHTTLPPTPYHTLLLLLR